MPRQRKPSSPQPGLLHTLSSVQFAAVVLVAIATVAMVGTLIPQNQPYEFYQEHFNPVILMLISVFRFDDTYRSPMFLGLLSIFGVNLLLCTAKRITGAVRAAFGAPEPAERETVERMQIRFSAEGVTPAEVGEAFRAAGFGLKESGANGLAGEKGRIGHLGAMIVHLGLMVILAGGVVSLVTGRRGSIVLVDGESTALAQLADGNKIPLGFTVELDSFRVAFYENYPDRAKSYTSSVTVTRPDGSSFKKDIRVNHPLMLNGFTIFQSNYGSADEGMSAEGANDTTRVDIRLKSAPPDVPPITSIEMTAGGEYPIPGFGDSIRVRLAELHSDFSMGSEGDVPNPAVKLDVLVRGEVRWSVYAFKNYPGMNMPMDADDKFLFTMHDLRSGETGRSVSGAERYFSLLGAVRDRGIPFVWCGALIMMAGLFISFTMRPRKIRVIVEDGTAYVGAWKKGDPDDFRAFVGDVVCSFPHRTDHGVRT
jgi:cytochrome c biogenesis protein